MFVVFASSVNEAYSIGNNNSLKIHFRQKSTAVLSWISTNGDGRLTVRGADSPGPGEYNLEIEHFDSSSDVKSTLFSETVKVKVLDFDCSNTPESILITASPIKIYKDFSPTIRYPFNILSSLGRE